MSIPHRFFVFFARKVRRRRDYKRYRVVGYITIGIHITRVARPKCVNAGRRDNIVVAADLRYREPGIERRCVMSLAPSDSKVGRGTFRAYADPTCSYRTGPLGMARTIRGRRRKTTKNHANKLHQPYDIMAEPSAQIVACRPIAKPPSWPVNVSAVLDPVNHHHLVRFRDRDLRRHLCLGQWLAASGPRPRL